MTKPPPAPEPISDDESRLRAAALVAAWTALIATATRDAA